MPKSRKRRPKKPAQIRRSPTKTTMPRKQSPVGQQRQMAYKPSKVSVDTRKWVEMAVRMAPGDLAVVMLPAVLLLDRLDGRSANVCIDACVTLHEVYRIFGIDARLVPVSLASERNGQTITYATSPRWDGDIFEGHSILWLPGQQRLVDPTIQQFPELSGQGGPFVGRIVAASGDVAETLPTGSKLPVIIDGAPLTYIVEGPETLLVNTQLMKTALNERHDKAANLAGWAMSYFLLPGLVDKVRAAPFPRLHALMDALAGAEAVVSGGNYQFRVADQSMPLHLDEISVE